VLITLVIRVLDPDHSDTKDIELMKLVTRVHGPDHSDTKDIEEFEKLMISLGYYLP
jgi:hypothetical protein